MMENCLAKSFLLFHLKYIWNPLRVSTLKNCTYSFSNCKFSSSVLMKKTVCGKLLHDQNQINFNKNQETIKNCAIHEQRKSKHDIEHLGIMFSVLYRKCEELNASQLNSIINYIYKNKSFIQFFQYDTRFILLLKHIYSKSNLLHNSEKEKLNEVQEFLRFAKNNEVDVFSLDGFCYNKSKQDVYFDDLTYEMRLLDNYLKPLQLQFEQKKRLVDKVSPLLEKFTGGQLHTFGSCDNGFWIRGSDVDTCLVLKNCSTRIASLSKLKLIKSLLEHEHVGNVQVIPAQVPIAKVYDGRGLNICDISLNNTAALMNSSLAATFCKIDRRARPLGRFIKYWASRRQINNRSQGTLSTYTLLLQLFYFLQTTNPPILPLYKDIEISEISSNEELIDDQAEKFEEVQISRKEKSKDKQKRDDMSGELKSLPFVSNIQEIREKYFEGYNENKQSLGELLNNFFMLFGGNQFSGGVIGKTISIYDGHMQENSLGVLIMKCPLTNKNVNPFTIPVWKAIYHEFRRAKLILSRGGTLEELCKPGEPPLRRAAHWNIENRKRVSWLLDKLQIKPQNYDIKVS